MPLNLASPGIVIREVDLTIGRVDPTSGSTGALVAPFSKGPVGDPQLIESENDLLQTFGQPYSIDKHYEHWMVASSYLAYGGSMHVVRAGDDGLKNAFAGTASDVTINGQEHYKQLQYDLEYENVLMASMRGRNGQIVGQGFSGKKTQLGVRMTSAVKKLGCSNLKTMMEDDKLLTCDYEIISALTTFAQKHNSFEAEEGCNDDLAMCLVIFDWLVAQDYFKEMSDNDIRKRIYEEQKNQIEQDMAPFGFIADGLDDTSFVDKDGDTWHLDEYGDRSYMWDYM